jgi:hypothetical protein
MSSDVDDEFVEVLAQDLESVARRRLPYAGISA